MNREEINLSKFNLMFNIHIIANRASNTDKLQTSRNNTIIKTNSIYLSKIFYTGLKRKSIRNLKLLSIWNVMINNTLLINSFVTYYKFLYCVLNFYTMSIKHQQIDEPLYILKGFKIPLLNTYFQEPYLSPINVKQQLSSRSNNQPFFESSTTKTNATSREFYRFEPLKVDKTQQNKQLQEKSPSPNKLKFLEDNKLKGLLNIVSDRNKQIHLKQYDFPVGGSTNKNKYQNAIKIQFSKEDLENNKKFLINTLRKSSVVQNQEDIQRPVRSKSDFEKVRSKSNLKQASPYKDRLIEEQYKKKTVRFNELVEIKMFERIKSHLMKQLI